MGVHLPFLEITLVLIEPSSALIIFTSAKFKKTVFKKLLCLKYLPLHTFYHLVWNFYYNNSICISCVITISVTDARGTFHERFTMHLLS